MKRYLIAAIALAVIVIAAVIGCFTYPVFAIKNFQVSGTHYALEDVEKASGLTVGGNLLTMNANSAAQGIATLPWIKTAHVDRKFPDTVTVDITERIAVLWAQHDDGQHIIDDQGIPFTIDVPPAGVPQVTGLAEDNTDAYMDIITCLNGLDPNTRGQVASVDYAGPNAIRVLTQDGHNFYWGSSEKADQKGIAMRMLLGRAEKMWNISNPALVTTP
ncbi:MAG: FtsQ-type POTRA domain-containing protein [Corynebacterium sp.]|nr:FtsQ-type POTRA domain-containing protein [Corynebacterium sp.]